jgi:hypothetical protein
VKRLLILLVVLAGGLAAASFTVPSDAATVNGVSISQNELNSEISDIANAPGGLYACFLNAEQIVASQGQSGLPPIAGAGSTTGSGTRTTATTAFVSNYLDTDIGHQLVLQIAAAHHVQVTSSDLATARTGLEGQITTVMQQVSGSPYTCGTGAVSGSKVLSSLPSSFVSDMVHFDATISVLSEYLSGVGSSTAKLEQYFRAHRSLFDTTCFTVAQYSSAADASAALAKVNAGTPFATVAAQVPGGGPQGCDVLYGIASQLPSAGLQALPINAVSSPINAGSSYLLIEITSRTPTPFQTAEPEVQSAVRSAGAAKTQAAIAAAERHATVVVDPRYGQWKPTSAQILAPISPRVVDVLNSPVDSPLSGGTSSASSGQSG